MRLAQLILASCSLFGGVCVQADNLEPFVGQVSHPICGFNDAFEHHQSVPAMPFVKCRTLAIGYSVHESYPDPGVDALSKLLIAIADSGVWDFRFAPLNEFPLECQIGIPLGSPPDPIPSPNFGAIPAPDLGAIPAPGYTPPPGPLPLPNSASAHLPPCTGKMLKDYVDKYDAQPIVGSVKRFEERLRKLDLNDSDTVQQLLKATAVLKVVGNSITLDELTKSLE